MSGLFISRLFIYFKITNVREDNCNKIQYKCFLNHYQYFKVIRPQNESSECIFTIFWSIVITWGMR